MRPYWISWYQTKALGAFELSWPWWITGETGDGKAETICAAVRAENQAAAEEIILSSFDKRPQNLAWRFCDEKPEGWAPFTDRFERGDWMRWENDGSG